MTMTDIEWKDPAPVVAFGRPRVITDDFLAALTANRGRWAIALRRTGDKRRVSSQISALASTYNRRHTDFEFTTRMEGDTGVIYARAR